MELTPEAIVEIIAILKVRLKELKNSMELKSSLYALNDRSEYPLIL
jgi:hypothetical protein